MSVPVLHMLAELRLSGLNVGDVSPDWEEGTITVRVNARPVKFRLKQTPLNRSIRLGVVQPNGRTQWFKPLDLQSAVDLHYKLIEEAKASEAS